MRYTRPLSKHHHGPKLKQRTKVSKHRQWSEPELVLPEVPELPVFEWRINEPTWGWDIPMVYVLYAYEADSTSTGDSWSVTTWEG